MIKSVLIIDTPVSCDQCSLLVYTLVYTEDGVDELPYCPGSRKLIEHEYDLSCASFCPLKSIPEFEKFEVQATHSTAELADQLIKAVAMLETYQERLAAYERTVLSAKQVTQMAEDVMEG